MKLAILTTLVALSFSLAAPAGWAGEKGTWRGLAALATTSYTETAIADVDGHVVYHGTMEGVVFNDEGKSFLDKARYEVVFYGDSSGWDGGYKTFTMADGSQAFLHFEGTEDAPPVFKGNWKFIKGTGQYKGITGEGRFTVTMVSDAGLWDVLEGSYEIP